MPCLGYTLLWSDGTSQWATLVCRPDSGVQLETCPVVATTVILQYFVVHTGLWSRVSPCFGLVTKLCFCYCEDQENKNFAVVIYHSIIAV